MACCDICGAVYTFQKNLLRHIVVVDDTPTLRVRNFEEFLTSIIAKEQGRLVFETEVEELMVIHDADSALCPKYRNFQSSSLIH